MKKLKKNLKENKMKRRICTEVIKEMIKEIPEDKKDFISALKWNLKDASYKAPEQTLQWERTTATLQRFIITPKEDWEFKILSIFMIKDISELKKMFK